ncbi:Angelicin synthase [Lachnellula arida]|uniref:Angelicin synthase n=1 Tax=Lachnellula arida TaxID=1316785 RepID=A0A8T9BL29_9HELO|nr:Angelicin synthase [Lachnellula arida]
MTGMTAQVFCLRYLFGMPTAALQMYRADDSGFHEKPAPQSTVRPENRVDYYTHASLLAFTSGKHFSGFYRRWFKSFSARVQSFHELNDNWTQQPDLLAFFERNFALAVVEATCGTILERENPNLAEDLAAYARYSPSLSKGLPRCFAPSAYAVRDKLFANVKSWHKQAEKNFNPSSVDDDGDADPFWGSEFMRSRQKIFQGFGGFDEDAAAASDLGFIWALTYNIVPTAMWVVLEIHKEPILRSTIRTELKQEGLLGDIQSDDIQKVLNLPRLQSVYAECLRLYTQAVVPRETAQKVQINGWEFPKGSTIVISTDVAQLDKAAWNTGIDNGHPIEKFWAERFLSYPEDPNSGPIMKSSIIQTGRVGGVQDETQKCHANGPIFSEKTTVGHWIPYGGGARICPGRHFAKRAIMTAAATMTSNFDIQILASEEQMKMDSRGYGLAAQRPVGRIPYRIKRWSESRE